MADRVLSQSTYAAALARRRKYAPKLSESGLVAQPNFSPFSIGTVEHLLDIGMAAETIASTLSKPSGWVCNGFRAGSPDAALTLAEHGRRKHDIQALEARATNNELGLPRLTGTPKQITWAENIRAAHAKKCPASPHLATRTLAAWWIENQRTI